MKIAVGLSGGVDSAVCAAILKKYDIPFRAFFLDIENSKEDKRLAKELAEKFFFKLNVTNLKPVYKKFVHKLKDEEYELPKTGKGNVKARIRMTYLYGQAEMSNGLVVGTDNAAEIYVGYFTK
jgi:NAD+ synthase